MTTAAFRFASSLLLSVTVVVVVAGEPVNSDVQKVLDKYQSARPQDKDLIVYRLDWVPSLKEAKKKAAKEGRPIFLAVVTNSFGNLITGHC